ncbi:anti-sigma factor [Schaalia sp. 19OD2882]|uniref:anti-sigma factor family protein n=1 Tax=Schaalia sp. 19OD2882 TaxID=2794089 RepID=UPI001C1E90A8|nr:anti-sigma factor [Schaalia sp. 19OD2882]QWW20325.1 anti-sigma factor [Schaalia sp. 19OD2882]
MSEELTCEELRAQLDAYLDCEECDDLAALVEAGTLNGPDARMRRLLEAHARQCPHCATVVDAERHMRRALRRCYSHQAPEGLRASIMELTVSRSRRAVRTRVTRIDITEER